MKTWLRWLLLSIVLLLLILFGVRSLRQRQPAVAPPAAAASAVINLLELGAQDVTTVMREMRRSASTSATVRLSIL